MDKTDDRTMEHVEHWCANINSSAVDDALEALQMRNDGFGLEKRTRLQKWLMGDYTQADFLPMPNDFDTEAQIMREHLRHTFVEQTALN